MRNLSVIVIGEPASQGSKKHVGRGVMVESSKKTKPWRDRVTAAAADALAEQQTGKFLGPVRIRVQFVFDRPQHHYRSGRFSAELRANAPHWKTSAPDADKCVRAILDGLADAGVFRNDAQVCDLKAVKVYTDANCPYPAYCAIEVCETPR